MVGAIAVVILVVATLLLLTTGAVFVLAATEQHVVVRGQLKAVLLSDFDLLLFDDGVVKLGDSIAVDTDEMVVVVVGIENFKHRVSVGKTALFDQSCVFEQIEGAVDGGKAST